MRFADTRIRESETAITKEELLEEVKDRNAIICIVGDKVDAEVMDAAPELKVVANVAVGYDNIDIAEAKSVAFSL